MSFRSIPSSRYGGGGLDQVGLFCYGEGRYWWIYAPRVTLVSRSRLAGVTGFLRPPAHADPIGTVLIFGGRRLRRKGGLFVRVLLSYMAIYHGYGIRDLT